MSFQVHEVLFISLIIVTLNTKQEPWAAALHLIVHHLNHLREVFLLFLSLIISPLIHGHEGVLCFNVPAFHSITKWQRFEKISQDHYSNPPATAGSPRGGTHPDRFWLPPETDCTTSQPSQRSVVLVRGILVPTNPCLVNAHRSTRD